MDADVLCGLLAEPSRLRSYAAVVLGANTPEEVVGLSGLELPVAVKALAQAFEPGREYPEKVVNGMLDDWYPDHAMLRRYLVDAGLLTRADGVYRRVGSD
ncbi:MAG TPA: DUF2087 domain-containing protein [Kribbella sp.]|nr:DUF2087 domain-containing protein [Kribbella sp.]